MVESAVKPATAVNKPKKPRSPRYVPSENERVDILGERVKLGAMLNDSNLPESVKGEVARMLLMGNVQLLRRLKKAPK